VSIIGFVRQRVPRSVRYLTRIASGFALAGLGVFAIGILYPRPLAVIFSMSVGHVLGVIALGLYLIAIVIDSASPPTSIPLSTRGSVEPPIQGGPESRPSIEAGPDSTKNR
jgi:hypothetical protein